MSKALFVANYSNKTGYAWSNIYRLFDFLAGELNKFGIECFLSFSRIEGDVKFSNFSRPILRYEPYGISLKNAIRLLTFVRENEIEYVYFTDQSMFKGIYFLLRLAGVRSIIVHNRVSVPNPRSPAAEQGVRRLYKAMKASLPLFNADRVYAVSSFVKTRLVGKACYPERKVITILNGIDLDAFAPRPIYEEGVRVRVFACGRATRHKGIDVLIRAVAELENPAVEVDYYGDGPSLASFKALAAELGVADRFHFKGAVPSTQPYLNRYDIACVPSVWGDACPSTVSESLAAGVPLVATDAGGIREMVGGPDNAMVVPPGNHKELAAAIGTMAGNFGLRQAYRRNGRERAEDALSLRRYYRNVLAQILADFGLEPDRITTDGSEGSIGYTS